jgi:phage tail-like protein
MAEEDEVDESENPQPRPKLAGTPFTRKKREPALGFMFSVEARASTMGVGLLPFPLDIKGYFTGISGLAAEYEVIEYKSTNLLGFPRSNTYPGRPIHSPITLSRGVTSNEHFWLWHQLLVFGIRAAALTATISLTIYDRSYAPMASFSIENAWPSKVSGIDVRPDSNDVLIEELVLQHSGVSRDLLVGESLIVNNLLQALIPS